jgi:RHS repeat-associated protein
MIEAAKEEISSSFVPWCAEMCISASEREGEKPHQGFAGKNPALHQGSAWSNSTTALGLCGLGLENRVRSRRTGKERDPESNLDYFGARYNSSQMGRFMTPDWSDDPEAAANADLTDPQTLNLYSYVRNNPLSLVDPDGHMQVCSATTSSTDENGDMVVNANCYDIPDPVIEFPISAQLGFSDRQQPQVTNQVIFNPSMPSPSGSNLAFVAGYGATGAITGGAIGGFLGGGTGGMVGAAGGTLFAPGFGTIGGGAAGAPEGGSLGFEGGSYLGATAGTIIGNIMCAQGRSGGGGDNQRQNKQASDARSAAERQTGKKFTLAQIEKFHDLISKQRYGYRELVKVAVDVLEGRL